MNAPGAAAPPLDIAAEAGDIGATLASVLRALDLAVSERADAVHMAHLCEVVLGTLRERLEAIELYAMRQRSASKVAT